MTKPLSNYLKMYRKRSGFSLEELGFLLGHQSGSAPAKHERFRRLPTIPTSFAYEVVFREPASELFRGLYQQVERDTIRRALELAKRLGDEPGDARSRLKHEALKAIYVPFTIETKNHDENE